MTPFNTISLKLIEKTPLLYFFVTGLLFILVPSTLSSPVYDHWDWLSARQWGALLLSICVLHVGALWWNGRSAFKSRIMRAFALIGYMYISIHWGINFVLAGAYWGAVLFWGLMPLLCVALYLRLVSEIKIIKEAR